MNQSVIKKLTPALQKAIGNEIPNLIDSRFLIGDNQKYMKMYDWMSKGYDFAESIIGKLKYGNSIKEMRTEIMSKLDWRNDCSVLYISIGTGNDLQFIPKKINIKSLNFIGADISIGMLRKCKKKFENKMNLSLIQCCAESLPFQDNTFDIVFHVGGINFFNDKSLAIQEMIRVAKPNNKILIADETNDYIEKQYKKSTLSKKYFIDKKFDFTDIINAIPIEVKDIETTMLWNNKFYCITFKKTK